MEKSTYIFVMLINIWRFCIAFYVLNHDKRLKKLEKELNTDNDNDING